MEHVSEEALGQLSGWKQKAIKLISKKSKFEQSRAEKLTQKKLSVADFCKGLAEPDDPEERDRALDLLKVFLPDMTDWSELTIRRLWHGLWMCMWHSDRPLVQLETGQRISKLLKFIKREIDPTLKISKPCLWVAGFWKEAIDEWPNLDFFRIDKFLSLARYMLYNCFKVLQEETTTVSDAVFLERTLVMVMTSTVKGLGLHLCDIWLDEAARAELPAEHTTRTLVCFFQAFVKGDIATPAFHNRMMTNVFCRRLLENREIKFDKKLLLEKFEMVLGQCKNAHKSREWSKPIRALLAPEPKPKPKGKRKERDEDLAYVLKWGLMKDDQEKRRKKSKKERMSKTPTQKKKEKRAKKKRRIEAGHY